MILRDTSASVSPLGYHTNGKVDEPSTVFGKRDRNCSFPHIIVNYFHVSRYPRLVKRFRDTTDRSSEKQQYPFSPSWMAILRAEMACTLCFMAASSSS